MKNKRILTLRIAIIVICLVWQGVIFALSAETSEESGGRSQDFCEKVAEIIINTEEPTEEEITELADRMEPPLRSLAHMFCFAVLGGLYFLMFTAFRVAGIRRSLLSLLLALVYAVFDETHQCFVPGRSFQLVDIAVDMSGALLAVLVISLIFILISKWRNKNEKRCSR